MLFENTTLCVGDCIFIKGINYDLKINSLSFYFHRHIHLKIHLDMYIKIVNIKYCLSLCKCASDLVDNSQINK